jgi:hypothetical protein
MLIDPSRLLRLAFNSGGIYPSRIPVFIIYLLKIMNSFLFSLVEQIFFGRKISSQKIHSPVIILGHYRSGTTLLHKFLLTDKRFGFITYTNVIFPFCSILSTTANRYLGRFIQWMHFRNWAFNNTVLNPEDPTEEDILMASSGMKFSIAWGFLFPLNAEKLLTDSVVFGDQQSREKWQAAYLYTLKKISYKSNGKRLLLKNPPNTGRISALLELFPDAKFIFIHRNPYHVFRSMQNLWQRSVRKFTLQKFSERVQDEIIFKNFQILMNRYLEEKSLIPKENLVEIRYEDFKQDPFHCLERIYRDLNIDGFETLGDDLWLAVSKENKYEVST